MRSAECGTEKDLVVPHSALPTPQFPNARVIEVEMRVDDDRDVAGFTAGHLKKGLSKRLLSKDTVLCSFFLAPLLAYPGFDQNLLFTCVDEHAVHVQTNTMQLIRRTNTLPKNTRDDSKHRPAVQSEFRVRNYFDLIVSDLHQFIFSPEELSDRSCPAPQQAAGVVPHHPHPARPSASAAAVVSSSFPGSALQKLQGP